MVCFKLHFSENRTFRNRTLLMSIQLQWGKGDLGSSKCVTSFHMYLPHIKQLLQMKLNSACQAGDTSYLLISSQKKCRVFWQHCRLAMSYDICVLLRGHHEEPIISGIRNAQSPDVLLRVITDRGKTACASLTPDPNIPPFWSMVPCKVLHSICTA